MRSEREGDNDAMRVGSRGFWETHGLPERWEVVDNVKTRGLVVRDKFGVGRLLPKMTSSSMMDFPRSSIALARARPRNLTCRGDGMGPAILHPKRPVIDSFCRREILGLNTSPKSTRK
jgi:hypothetical protein